MKVALVILAATLWVFAGYWRVHARAERECQCIVIDGDDGDETFDGCVNRRVAEIRASLEIRK